MEESLHLTVSYSGGEAPSLLGRLASVRMPKDRSSLPQRAQSTYTAGQGHQCWREKPAMGLLRGEQLGSCEKPVRVENGVGCPSHRRYLEPQGYATGRSAKQPGRGSPLTHETRSEIPTLWPVRVAGGY